MIFNRGLKLGFLIIKTDYTCSSQMRFYKFSFLKMSFHTEILASVHKHTTSWAHASEGGAPRNLGGLFSWCRPLWHHHTEGSSLLLEGGWKHHSQWTLTCGLKSRSWACTQSSESKAAPSPHGLGDLPPPLASDGTTSREQSLTTGSLCPSRTHCLTSLGALLSLWIKVLSEVLQC